MGGLVIDLSSLFHGAWCCDGYYLFTINVLVRVKKGSSQFQITRP